MKAAAVGASGVEVGNRTSSTDVFVIEDSTTTFKLLKSSNLWQQTIDGNRVQQQYSQYSVLLDCVTTCVCLMILSGSCRCWMRGCFCVGWVDVGVFVEH